MIGFYYQLIKPGIVRGNLITAAAGFLFASQGKVDFVLLTATLLATALIVASGCVFNNILDIGIDSSMGRTKKRPLVSGKISKPSAMIFGAILGVFAFFIFVMFVNFFAAIVAITGFVFYVVVYGYWKRKSIHGTLVGSISGAIPPVIGYVAVVGRIDLAATLLFLVLVAWQMPHFYAIGIYRISDYKDAGLPILSVVKGAYFTKLHMIVYVILFIITTSLFTLFGLTGYIYLVVIIALGLVWLFVGMKGFVAKDDNAWAKQMFSYSLYILLAFSVLISIDFYLPF